MGQGKTVLVMVVSFVVLVGAACMLRRLAHVLHIPVWYVVGGMFCVGGMTLVILNVIASDDFLRWRRRRAPARLSHRLLRLRLC
jgi:hypothetical protein